MLPNSRSRPPLRAIDLLAPLILIVIFGWFLVNRLVGQQSSLAASPELQRAAHALETNNTGVARAQFDRFLQSQPDRSLAYSAISDLCSLYHRADLAIEYAQRGLKQTADTDRPARALLYVSLASALAANGPSQAMPARAAARQALSLDPDNPEILNGAGYVIADTSTDAADLNEALQLTTRAISLLDRAGAFENRDMAIAEFEDSYGWALYKIGRYVPGAQTAPNRMRAVDALMQAIADLPDGVPNDTAKVLYYHLGAAASSAGLIDQARNAIQVALRYDPKYTDALEQQRIMNLSHTSPSTSAFTPLPPPYTSAIPAH